MASLDPSSTRRRKNGMFELLPSFVSSESGEEEIYPVRRRGNWLTQNQETIREVALVLVGLIFVFWLFFGDSKGASQQLRWGSRPLINTPQSIIVPSISGGTDRDGLKKAPGDNSGIFEVDMVHQQQDNPNAYLYVGAKSPSVVVVTVLDDVRYPRDYLNKIIENRVEYAQAHNYGVYIRMARDYKDATASSNPTNSMWSRAAISREAMAVFPNTKYFWFIDESAIIMNPLVDIEKEFIAPSGLEKKMLRNARVVREFDYIHSLKNNRAADAQMVLTRDVLGVTGISFIYHNTLLCKSILEVWLDPLYRFHKKFNDENEALRHQMQWHSLYFNKIAVVASKLLSSYALAPQGDLNTELAYTDGDFTAYFDCDYSLESCKKEFQKFWNGRGRVRKATPSAPPAPKKKS